MNPLLNILTSSNPMLSQFMDFMNSFKGDPKAEIDKLIKSGKISEAQYNEAVNKAKQLEPLLKSIMR